MHLKQFKLTFLALIFFAIGPHATFANDNIAIKGQELRTMVKDIVKINEMNEAPEVDQKKKADNLRTVIYEHHLLLKTMLENPEEAKEIVKASELPFPSEFQEEVFPKNILPFSIEEQIPLIPDELCLMVLDQIDENIQQIKFSQTAALKSLTDPNKGIDLSSTPKSMADLLHTILTQYFDQLPLVDKRQILIGQLELPPGSSDSDQLGAFVQNAGPVIQKLFQLIGKNAKSDLVVKVLEELKSHIKTFPSAFAINEIEKSYGKPINEIFVEFPQKPLAAASVGQVYLAKLKDLNTDVIIKVRRPGIEAKANREFDLLESLAGSEGEKGIIRSLKEALFEELDFHKEAEQLTAGKKVYHHPEKGLYVVKLLPNFPVSENVMMMEKAEGKTFDKQNEKSQQQKKLLGLKKLYQLWLKNALFGNGFIHADLRSGNLFFQEKSESPGYRLTLIDFGSMGQLTTKEQKSIINLALGVATQSPQTVLESFLLLTEMSEEKQEKFKAEIVKILKGPIANSESAGKKTAKIVNVATNMGIILPKNFLQFNRGKAFIENHIWDQIQDLKKAGVDLSYEQIQNQLSQDVFLEGLEGDIFKAFFGLGHPKTIVKKSLYKKMITKIFKDNFFHKNKKACQKH